jgi:hypothetical protein
MSFLQGYGDLHAYNVAEAIFVVLYMFVSIGVAAYFVGTSVLLVVENEKKTGAYRCVGTVRVCTCWQHLFIFPSPLWARTACNQGVGSMACSIV